MRLNRSKPLTVSDKVNERDQKKFLHQGSFVKGTRKNSTIFKGNNPITTISGGGVGPGSPPPFIPPTYDNAINIDSNVVKLGGTLIEDTSIDGDTNTYDLRMLNIDEAEITANQVDIVTPLMNLDGEDSTLEGSTILKIKTPLVSDVTTFNGYNLTLLDKTTGECEWKLRSGQSLYDANVSTDPANGDFTSIADAITSGAKTIWVQEGVYNETVDLTLVDGAVIVGEGPDTVINFAANTGFKATAPAGKTNGTITATNGSTTITGAGTTFAVGDVDSWIRIGQAFYKVATYVSGTEITIDRSFEGETFAGLSYVLRDFLTGISLTNLTIIAAGSGGASTSRPIQWDGVLFGELHKIVAQNAVGETIYMNQCGWTSIKDVITRGGTEGIELQNCSAVNVKDLATDSASSNGMFVTGTGDGVNLTNCFFTNSVVGFRTSGSMRNIALSACSITGNDDRGAWVQLTGPSNVTFTACNFERNGITGLLNNADDTVVTGCTFKNHNSIAFNSTSSSQFIGNKIDDCVGGVNVTLAQAKIIGNEFINITSVNAVRCDGDNSIISNNTFDTVDESGITVTLANNCIITNNYFTGVDGTTGGAAIFLGGDGHIVDHNIFGTNAGGNFDPGSATNYTLEGRVYNNLQTTDDTLTQLAAIPIPDDNKMYSLIVHIGAYESAANYGMWIRRYVFRKDAGVVTLLQTSTIDTDVEGGVLTTADWTATVVGTNLEIDVTGVPAVATTEWTTSHVFENITRIDS